MILRAHWVVTMEGPPIADGAVWIKGNKIGGVGRLEELRATNVGSVIDLGECALLPGLINAHCHLEYTDFREKIPARESFTGWIQEINARKAEFAAEDYRASIARGFAEAASFGTTTLANLEAFPELLDDQPRPPLRTWWFGEMIDVRAPVSPEAVYEKMRAAFERGDDWLGGVGLAPHAPFTASRELYAEAARLAARLNFPLTTHLAESREEMAMFRDGGGELFEFMRGIGRPMDDCGGATPLARMFELLNERWLVAHLNELTTDDFSRLASGPRFQVVHCPRSHAYFGHTPFAFAKLRDLGFNICLGTDSLASNASLSLFAEMRQLRVVEPAVSAREVLELVTTNAAAALGQQNSLGRIRAGYLADLIAVPTAAEEGDVFENVVAFDGRIDWTMIDGRLPGVA